MNALLLGTAEQVRRMNGAAVLQRPAADSSVCVPTSVTGREHANERSLVRLPVAGVSEEMPTNAFMQEMASMLLEKINNGMPELVTALKTRDITLIGEQAHWMKGTGGTVGLPIISTIGKALEQAVQASDLSMATAIVIQLQQAVEALTEQIAEYSDT